MTIQPTFSAQELNAYLKALGWTQVEAALKDGLYLFKNSEFGSRQLMFGIDSSFDDYEEALENTTRKLAQIYEWTFAEAIRRIEESNSEVLVSSVPDETRHVSTVSLLYASQVLEAQKELILSGAVAIEKRQAYYAKTLVGDAKKMLEAARFRHTEEGSFIFKTSCRLYEFENTDEMPLFSATDEPLAAPFVRRAMLNIGTGLEDLMHSIHDHKEEKLVESIKANDASPVSANFCDAVAELRDREHPHAVELWVSWSPLLSPPSNAPRGAIRIAPNDFPVIEEVAKALRPTNKPKRDTYVATVEKLEGTFNKLGQREGRVLLSLLSSSGGTIDRPTQVRVILDAPKYEEALEIHKTNKVLARVEGTIKRSQRQPFEFDLVSFKIINL
ncbi:MAG TPA: hypothetical protein VGB77_18600 [Abditibacteriaceae bacterium]|jgi:hypothetical protein